MSKNNSSDLAEVMLAEEQSVTLKSGGTEVQGTLVLTNKRLIFAAGNTEEDVVEVGIAGIPKTDRFRFADIHDLSNIPSDPTNLSIPLGNIEAERGHDGFLRPPSLRISWNEGGAEKGAEFSADISGGRKKSLKDWANVIEGLKSGRITVQLPAAQPPNKDTLEWRILQVLGDMQEKGVFEIEEQTEEVFKMDLDPDQVDGVCQQLATQGFLDKIPDPSGDNFYRKRSPLGEDDLSS